jgi:hypothetical protein
MLIETKLSGSGPLVIQIFPLSIYGASQTTAKVCRKAVDCTTEVDVATGSVE